MFQHAMECNLGLIDYHEIVLLYTLLHIKIFYLPFRKFIALLSLSYYLFAIIIYVLFLTQPLAIYLDILAARRFCQLQSGSFAGCY